MNIVKRIIGLFSVMEDEAKSFRLLFLQSLLIGFANSYYYIVSSSFLLKTIDIKNLPYSYTITGIGGFILIKLYKSLQKKYGIAGSYRMSLFTFSLICFVNFFAMKEFSSDKTFSVFLAYSTVLFAAPFTAIFSLGLYAQCARLYNMAQSKRLLALVVSGEIFASVLAYLSAPFLRGVIKGNTFILLPVAGIFILLVFLPFNKTVAEYRSKFRLPVISKAPTKMDFSFFRKDKFYLLIAITTVFSVFAIYVVDYAYLISVRYMHNITQLEIAEIVSGFFFMVKIGELSFSFISGKFLSNRGIRTSLLLLPFVLLLFSSFAFIAGFPFMGTPIFLLSFLFLAKLTERAIRKSITTPSVKVMYQVAEPEERLEIEANIDGLLNQLATIFSGIILLVISLIFFGNDMFSLLHLFSFVCIVAFAFWAFFSIRMYDSYRVRIKDFLLRLKTSKVAIPVINDLQRASDSEIPTVRDIPLIEKIKPALDAVNTTKKEELVNLIKFYNSKQTLDFATEKEDKIVKKLINIYYSNHFYFSRLLIVRYLKYCNDQTAFNFFRELWEVSNLIARLELIITFNEGQFKNIEVNFFERLCEDCVREIIWTETAIYDLQEFKDEALDQQLHDHKELLICTLFELLKAIYEPSVIQVTFEIIIQENAEMENELFALELLDITLRPGLKEMVKHILEPTTFETKKQLLGKTFHIYNLSPLDRLIDILMKDYNLVNPGLKESALISYYKHSDEKNVLEAFRSNIVDSLKYKAEEIYSGIVDPASQVKKEALFLLESNYHSIKPFLPYLFNHALFVQNPNRAFANNALKKNSMPAAYTIEIRTADNSIVKLDALALAILVTLKQNEMFSKYHVLQQPS